VPRGPERTETECPWNGALRVWWTQQVRLYAICRDLDASEISVRNLGVVSTFTVWRFFIEIPLSDSEMKIQYSINGGFQMCFFVPGRRQTMRVAAYSVSDLSRRCLVLS
jgi:hypothetical protein